jgi:hypothetical protein
MTSMSKEMWSFDGPSSAFGHHPSHHRIPAVALDLGHRVIPHALLAHPLEALLVGVIAA